MKWIKFTRIDKYNIGTEAEPEWAEISNDVMLSYCEYNEEIAKKEAYNGEYTIEDDGQPEPVVEPTTDEILNAMLGVSE